MNMLSKNVRYLLEIGVGNIRNPTSLAKVTGVSQPTARRIVEADEYDAKADTVDAVAAFYGVTPDVMRYTDLSSLPDDGLGVGLLPKKGYVRIKMIEDFVSDDPRDRFSGVTHHDFPLSWYAYNVDLPPEQVRLAIQRDDSMRGEIEIGELVFVDTALTDVSKGGSAKYAITYFESVHIHFGQKLSDNHFIFKGTKASLSTIEVEGKDFDGLRVWGRVIAKLHVTKM